MKKLVDSVDATPSKRLYRSIIADYDLDKGICELIDNALDIWIKNNKVSKLRIDISLDATQQTITVKDNAGGVNKEDLSNVVGPGHSSNSEKDVTIGIFGVGTKRAVVALAQDIKIKTRRQTGSSHQVEFDDEWFMNSDDWRLPVYEISEIDPSSTIIELTRLRINIDDLKINSLRQHLGGTYSRFLKHNNLKIILNGNEIAPVSFEKWAYPPAFEPRNYSGTVLTSTGDEVFVEAIAGLTTESNPSGGEWGVYVYCNDRLIVSGLKSFDVGFASGLAGKPHPDISLMRVLLFISGSAKLMPWNSSKSDVNSSHEVFIAIQSWLVNVVSDYASLSRRFNKMEGGWPENVFKYDSGKIKYEKISDFKTANTSYLPPLPEFKPRYSQKVKNANKDIVRDKPWTRGLYESIIAVDLIYKQNLEQKNRICLVLLDSTLEIGFKEYLVYESGIAYSDERLQAIFKDRTQVHQQVKQNAFKKISATDWQSIEYYYKIRCDLIHRRSTATIPDIDIDNYKKVVIKVLQRLFGLNLKSE
ncbi:MAG: ATP-binding protein [Anaerolineales bacterium]|nr:ATP-binding protein [Anaerolineales bacterium]